jgi:hypothetical protein
MGGTLAGAPPGILTRTEFDQDVKERLDDVGADGDLAGWWCIATAPFRCHAQGCDFVAAHCTAAHLVVVWPEKDDPQLLRVAADCRELGRDPRVVEWTPDAGRCISYYHWTRIGRPVHGKMAKPPGWDARRRPHD